MKFKIRYADQIVGILTIIALVALIALLFSIGTRQRWFLRKYMYHSDFETAANLSDGMSVMYKGFDIGKIGSISLTKEDVVRVEFFIYSTFKDKMRKGSIIELVVSPIGLGSQLLFISGNGEEILPEDSFIPRRDSAEAKLYVAEGLVNLPNNGDGITAIISVATETLRSLDETIKGIQPGLFGTGEEGSITPLARIVDGLASSIESFNELLSDPVGLIPKLLESDGSISALFNDKNALYISVLEAIETVNGTLKNVDGLVAQVDTTVSDASGLIQTLNTTVQSTDGIIKNVEQITADVSSDVMPQVPLLVQELQISLLKMQDVLIGLKNNPLLKGGIPDRTQAQGVSPQLRDTQF